MDDILSQLDRLNAACDDFYNFVEKGDFRVTRRRLLVVQCLVYADLNANATRRLLETLPHYTDGAAMILRSIYDMSITSDWILKNKSNKRLWRWLRDDRKTLHTQLQNTVRLKTKNPKLEDLENPLVIWQSALKKVEKELIYDSKKSGTTIKDGGIPLYQKAKELGEKTEVSYNTVFWLLSGKTHATPTGLQELMKINPIRLIRRNDAPDAKESEYAEKLMLTAITWYAANAKRAAKYLSAPQLDHLSALLDELLNRSSTPSV